MNNEKKTGFDRLREVLGTDEQDPYILIALSIKRYHEIEKEGGEIYLTEWFDNSWIDLERTAYFMANEVVNCKKRYENTYYE